MTTIPQGFMQNSQGHLIPESLVSDIDKQRDELVIEIVKKAKDLNSLIAQFKDATMGDIAAFIELSAERYDVYVGGNKGNVTLMSFNGQYKVQRNISEIIRFDEALKAAKALIDECVDEWIKDTRSEVKVIVDQAFSTNKQGELSTSKVLGLLRLEIKEEKWKRAMQAIKDSIRVDGTKSYIRIYEREEGKQNYHQIPLDLASI
ncbi:DUF3164 family protein [Thiomicrorhabdus sp. Kp2]|uniref:DUF3164 family protein n=1 Tax=Thiomicrorhabdus sp. Kp2 TaxID=1123518 RepID=UPI00041D86D3|nr:DUF3164 family protein [Thiomicrorhabdus sp. Kp2]